MKKPLDIGALIDEKFKTKSNKFGWNELLEEIDNVLNEQTGPYGTKFGENNVSNAIPENVRQGIGVAHHANGNSRSSYNEMSKEHGFGKQPHLRVSTEALIGEDEATKKAQSYTIEVPDIFSLITNSEMKEESEDNKLIARIVRNLETEKGNWILRIQKINEFTQTAADNPVETKDIRKAISALIFLNLLKKLAYFTAQPGKLFEYILRPLIGTGAKVLGSVDQQIVDVTKESQGQVWDYSLKMFTGKDSNFTIKGSAKNLNTAALTRGRPITYIVSTTNRENNSLEFAELLISNIPQHLPANEWKIIKSYPTGLILVKEGACGILVVDTENEEKLTKLGYETILTPEKTPSVKEPIKNVIQMGRRTIPADIAEQQLQQLKSSSEVIQKTTQENKINYLQKSRSGVSIPVEERSFIESLKNILNILSKIPEFRGTNVPNLTQATYGSRAVLEDLIKLKEPNQKLETLSDILQKAKQYETSLETALSAAQNQPSTKNEEQLQEVESSDEQENEKKQGRFSIPIKGIWQLIPNKIPLNLGNPEQYNKQQLSIASGLAESMNNTLKAFQELNINLVNFFATSKEQAKEGDFGTKAIQNAETISENVAAFQAEEDQSKPPEEK